MNIINVILDKLKSALSEADLNKICNSYDDNGFTPLLKLIYEYHQNISTIFTNIKKEETYDYKKEKILQQGDNIETEQTNNSFLNNNLGFGFGNSNYNNKNSLENRINAYILNPDEIKIIHEKSIKKIIDFILSLIKKFVSLKMDPMIKVGKLLKYRENNKDNNKDSNKEINSEIKENKDDNENIESTDDSNKLYAQYFNNQGENSILLYLMKYPNKKLLDYFLKELKIPVNICNIYQKNALYFLFDNIDTINTIENNTFYIIDILNYLMDQGINIEQIDHLGNNPFLYLAMNNFDINILKILHTNKCDINKFNKDDYNSLFYYIRQKNLENVKTLIEDFKVDYTLCDSKKRTIMHYLCNDEISSTDMDESLCDYLLTKKIALNQPDILGRIPIHYLFVKINDEYNSNDIDPVTTLTKFLEYNEVDAEYKDIYGNTPLHYACQRGSIISVISLGGKKINYDVKNKENNSPLAYSLLFKKENVAINLIQQKVDLDQFVYPLKDRNKSKLNEKSVNNKTNKLNILNNNYKRKVRKRLINNSINILNPFVNDPLANNNLFNNNPFGNNVFGSNLNNNTFTNNIIDTNNETINNNISNDSTNKKGVKLFRLCIKNNFQGLTHLFITRGYSLNKAVEDCFYEEKFNLAKKLLTRSPYNETYQGLNLDGQNLFHIIGNIKNNSNSFALPEFFQILLSKEIPLDLKDNFGITPLHYAAQNLYLDFIKFIINKYPNKDIILNMKNNDNNNPFNLATKGNNINIINKDIFNYLFTNVDINNIFEQDEKLINNNIMKKTTYKCSLLLLIVRKMINLEKKSLQQSNLFYFYKKLIEGGASIMEKDSYGRTCLNYAVLENNFDILKMLCKDAGKKLDKNIIDKKGKSLVHQCVSLNNFGSYENVEMLTYLLDNKFLSISKDYLNKTPLDYALEQKTLKNLTILKNKNILGTENIDINAIKLSFKNIQDEINEKIANSIPLVNFEKDSEEYYNYKTSNTPSLKLSKKPNVKDYQSEFYELYKENDEYWDASLTKVNLQNGIYGEYLFYIIQLIHDLGKDMYIVTTQFGRMGEEGANQRSPFNSLEEAKNEFCKIFKNKTSNEWEERNNFERKKGKYMLLTYNKIKIKPNELLTPFNYEKCPKSKITDENIINLLKTFTDYSIIEKAFNESGVDTNFFNYSMLNKEILIKARYYLIELYKKVQELEEVRKINIINNNINNNNDKEDKEDKVDNDKNKENKGNEASNDNNYDSDEVMEIEDENKNEIKTEKEKIDKIISINNEIMILSSRYYELIPKSRFRNCCILPLDNINQIKTEINIIDNLTYVEKAVNILLGANNKLQTMNPLDYIYYSLQTYFETLNKDSPEFETLKHYITNTASDEIINIFRVTRKGEAERINEFKDMPNHYLLFHGTKIFNLIGIFSNGLKIAPPEAPVTGYMFGKGIYLADMYEKSINYCDTFTVKEKNNNDEIKKTFSYILLCEAALGNMYESNKPDLDVENLPFLKEGFNSLKSCSHSGPDLSKNFVCNNGVIIPLGNIINYPQYNNNQMFINMNMNITSHPEYVVYNTSQIKIRYIVQVERK